MRNDTRAGEDVGFAGAGARTLNYYNTELFDSICAFINLKGVLSISNVPLEVFELA